MDSESQSTQDIFREFRPEDFNFGSPAGSWVPPCWISVPLVFRAVSERAKAVFPMPMKFEFQADPFARKAPSEQFSSQFFPIYEQAQTACGEWSEFLWQQFAALQHAFADTEQVLRPPMRFVPRAEFEKATLDTVLRNDPETFEIYLADDTDSAKRETLVLRIHSSLWHYVPNQKYLWYEKRVPWRLRAEDVTAWFDATVKKLPSKRQPLEWSAWKQKFLRSHPEFVPQEPSPDARWEEKSPIVLVFGTRDEVGYAALFHLDRHRIQSIKRSGEEILIRATIANRYEKEPEKLWWTFRIFSPAAVNAERLEARLISGEQVHFGLGDDISGIVATDETSVHFINVDSEFIKASYSREGMMLLSFVPPRFRHKTYVYYKEEVGEIEEAHRL